MPINMTPYRNAISGVESGGNYGIVGPEVDGDHAYGRYQVMGANIPSWTEAALGIRMTPEEFRASPAAQDAVFDHYFGGYVDQYGLEGASRKWFTGSATGTASDGYIDADEYVNRVYQHFGEPPSNPNVTANTSRTASASPISTSGVGSLTPTLIGTPAPDATVTGANATTDPVAATMNMLLNLMQQQEQPQQQPLPAPPPMVRARKPVSVEETSQTPDWYKSRMTRYARH